MGYVDEILFGKEVEDLIPALVAEWVALVKANQVRGADKAHPHGQSDLV